jgi:hypothetical protein
MVPLPRIATVRTSSNLSGTDAVSWNLDFADAFEGKEQLHQERGRFVFALAHDVADGVGDGGVEEDAFHLHAGEIDSNHLAWLEHFLFRSFCAEFD